MQTLTLPGSGRRGPGINWLRGLVVVLAATAIFLPLFLIFYQSFLTAPFFMPAKQFGLDAYRFIFDDPDFSSAAKNALYLALGLTLMYLTLIVLVPLSATFLKTFTMTWDAFFTAVLAIIGDGSETTTEPQAIDSIVATAPEDTEPVVLK